MADVRITLEQEAQFRSWANDPLKFINDVVRIESVTPVLDAAGNEVLTASGRPKVVTKVVPFKTRPYQDDVITRFLTTQVCAVLKARQIGLTTCACALALWLLMTKPNRFILVLSKNDRDAKKFMRRIRFMYDRLPPWVKARGPQLTRKWGVEEAEFDNGSIIFSATSSSDHGRGDTPTDVFLDEVGKMRNQEDSWSALIPATEAGGNLWMFGTANGYNDWFHRMWKGWVDDPDVDTIFYGWDVVEGRDGSWASQMRRKLGDALFRREYPATPDEAFVTSGSNVFSMEVLAEITPTAGRRVTIGKGLDGTLQVVELESQDDEFGTFIFEDPILGEKYLVAADPSEGLVDGDPTCIQVLKQTPERIEQVAVLRSRDEPDDTATALGILAALYNRASVIVERNNHGHTVLKALERARVPNVVRGSGGRPGLWTNRGSKGQNIALTRKALADGALILHDARTIDEMMGFQEKITASGNASYEGAAHDDHVDALCMGVGYAVSYAITERVAEVKSQETPHPYSFDGLMARRPFRRNRII